MQAYDSHCNLVLGEVEETIYIVEEDEDEQETVRVGSIIYVAIPLLTRWQTVKKQSEMLFVRGKVVNQLLLCSSAQTVPRRFGCLNITASFKLGSHHS